MLESNKLAAVVLAAGRGKRMDSDTPKVLLKLGGKPLIYHTLEKLVSAGIKDIFVVLHFKAGEVESKIAEKFDCKFVYQKKLLGTADALKCALNQIPDSFLNILVVNGDDSAFYSKKTIENFIRSHISLSADLTFMTLKLNREDSQLGRVIRDGQNEFKQVLEHSEYAQSGLFSDEINCGNYIFSTKWLRQNIGKIKKGEGGEFYLTDLLGLAVSEGALVNIFELKNKEEWFGVNTQDELKEANKLLGQKT